MRTVRGGLAGLFLFATLVAQGPHDHQRELPTVEAEFGSCDEAGRHWAGHDAARAHNDRDPCPICQFRSSLALPPIRVRLGVNRSAVPLVAVVPPLRVIPSNLPDRCRAPPRA